MDLLPDSDNHSVTPDDDSDSGMSDFGYYEKGVPVILVDRVIDNELIFDFTVPVDLDADPIQNDSVLNFESSKTRLLDILTPDRSYNLESEDHNTQVSSQGEIYLKYRRANSDWVEILVRPYDNTYTAHRIKIGSDSLDYVAINRHR